MKSKENFFYKFRFDYIVLLIVCLSIRLYHINTLDLWDDEIIGFFQWGLHTIKEYPLSIRKTPIYIIINVLYKSLMPSSWLYSYNFVPRIPALIFGVLTVIILYDAYKRYIDNIAAFIIGCFTCASYPLIIYAKESRVYSMIHFFVALYTWLYLSIIYEIRTWKITLLFVSTILGFFTYPYLSFFIIIIYACLSINILSKNVREHKKYFFTSFLCFIIFCAVMLFLMKTSFSSSYYIKKHYSPMAPSFSFIVYALKGMMSYYSCNSYILLIIAFIFPCLNLYHSYYEKKKLNYIYLLWIFSSFLMVAHVVILFLTVNIFNPRHVGFIAIPFIAAISYAIYEIYKYLSSFANEKYYDLFKIAFFSIVLIFSFTTRDFIYYLKTGDNYHAGVGKYSVNIEFIDNMLNEIGKNNSILLSCYNDTRTYYMYHYRTQKRVVSFEDFRKHKYYSTADTKYLYAGFVLNNKINVKEISKEIKNKFSIYQNSHIAFLLSKNPIDLLNIGRFVEENMKLICQIG